MSRVWTFRSWAQDSTIFYVCLINILIPMILFTGGAKCKLIC